MINAIPWIGSTMFFAGVIVGFVGAMRLFGIIGGSHDDSDKGAT